MIGIIMAGGKGSRMDLPKEKLLLQYKKPIVLHVIDAMIESNCFSKILALTSPNSPNTKNLLLENNIEIINTPGNGYVDDLNHVLQTLDESVMIVSGDLPFLDSKIIKEIVQHYNPNSIWTTILVTKEFLDSINLSSDYNITFNNQSCYFTGISLVNSNQIMNSKNVKEDFIIINDKKIAFNLNTKQDYELLGTT